MSLLIFVIALQWEYQVGPSVGIEAADHMWCSRYILEVIHSLLLLGLWNCRTLWKSIKTAGATSMKKDLFFYFLFILYQWRKDFNGYKWSVRNIWYVKLGVTIKLKKFHFAYPHARQIWKCYAREILSQMVSYCS